VSRLRLALLGVGAVVALVAAVVSYEIIHSRHSTPVAEQAAIARYRDVQGSTAPTGSPPPGVYAYDISGWECAGVGPLCLHRSLPKRAYAIVTRKGDRLTIEIDLSQEHLEAARWRITSRGRLLEWERAKISILGVSQDDAHGIDPPTTLAVPAKPRLHETWSQTFHDSSLPVHVVNSIPREQTLEIGGKPLTTWVIVSANVTGGAHAGTEGDVDWQDVATGLDAKMTIDRRINGAFPYRLEVTGTLRSTVPVR
jgi:hypothetical protein